MEPVLLRRTLAGEWYEGAGAPLYSGGRRPEPQKINSVCHVSEVLHCPRYLLEIRGHVPNAVARQPGPACIRYMSPNFRHLGTNVLSCMIGIRIEKTMKATPPPMATIMIGSSSEVSAVMRISVCDS
jgi:hypothetical protein